eukprot:SAG11_NODE_2114_length_3798_cov_9.451473_3_plen_173_part_00
MAVATVRAVPLGCSYELKGMVQATPAPWVLSPAARAPPAVSAGRLHAAPRRRPSQRGCHALAARPRCARPPPLAPTRSDSAAAAASWPTALPAASYWPPPEITTYRRFREHSMNRTRTKRLLQGAYQGFATEQVYTPPMHARAPPRSQHLPLQWQRRPRHASYCTPLQVPAD